MPVVAAQLDAAALGSEAEAEAEAKVGFEAAAAAASSSAAGFEGIDAQSLVQTNLYAAAAAAGAGEVVTLSVSIPAEGEAGEVIAEATATDSQGRSVAAAVAVAGVPTQNFVDNEMEAEQETEGSASVTVRVFTDPRDARNPTQLDLGEDDPEEDNSGQVNSDNSGSPESFLGEIEAEAEAESEAEAGYGAAAASSGAAASGIGSVSSAATSTSTDKYEGGYNFSSANSINNGRASNDNKTVVLEWTGKGISDFAIDHLVDGSYQQVGRAPGSAAGGSRQYEFRLLDKTQDRRGTFRIRDLDDPSNFRLVELRPRAEAIQPYPNPFTTSVRLPLGALPAQHALVTVHDVSGRLINTLYDGPVGGAKNASVEWLPTADRPAGIYLIRVVGDDFSDAYRVHYGK